MNALPHSATSREFELERVYAAPRDMVYRVWTDPRYVALWWGIDGATITRCEMDVQPGGAWRIDMRAPDGTVFPNGGRFLEVVANERLVYNDLADLTSIAWQANARGPLVHTVTFGEVARGDTRVSVVVRAASIEDRDRMVSLGMREGIDQSLTRLERLLQTLGPAVGGIPSTDSPR